jgi:hypothetical protein
MSFRICSITVDNIWVQSRFGEGRLVVQSLDKSFELPSELAPTLTSHPKTSPRHNPANVQYNFIVFGADVARAFNIWFASHGLSCMQPNVEAWRG